MQGYLPMNKPHRVKHEFDVFVVLEPVDEFEQVGGYAERVIESRGRCAPPRCHALCCIVL